MSSLTEISMPDSPTRQFEIKLSDRQFTIAIAGTSNEWLPGDIEPTSAPMTTIANEELGILFNALATACFRDRYSHRIG
jgi:hypothetical protein